MTLMEHEERMRKIKTLFAQLREEAEEKGIEEERVELLGFIEVEAELGCEFANRIKKFFPEICR